MAFSKFANARIIKADINTPIWDQVRDSAQALGSAFATREASKIALTSYNPKDYMLSHCTIVASVDTEDGPGKLGRDFEGGYTIDRQFSDYLISPQCTPFVNNNHDSWERKLLLSSFRTFVGGENYVEHLQIPEMSKGKILDAAARDIGDSVYIDILVATHRKHRPLIAAIESRRLQTLSMGCNVAFTVCTKCGNVAKDETELCPHIKYAKGNTFIDHLGRTLKIAELCGHVSSEPGSVKFIEASWVANPAFVGAVLRNVLTPEEAAVYNRLHAPKMQIAFSEPSRVADPSLMARAARSVPAHGFNLNDLKVGFDLGQGGQGGQEEFPGAGGDDPKEEDEDPMDKVVKDVANYIRDTAVNQVRQQLGPKSENSLDENRNDTIIQQASLKPAWQRLAVTLNKATNDPNKTRRLLTGLALYQSGGWRSVREAKTFSGHEVLAISKILDALHGVPKVAGEARIYRTVLAVGGSEPYGDVDTYLAACRRVLGRELTETEKVALIVKGKLFDLGT